MFLTIHETTQCHILQEYNLHTYHQGSLRFQQELTFTKLSTIHSFRGLFMRSCKVFIVLLEVCKSDTIVAE